MNQKETFLVLLPRCCLFIVTLLLTGCVAFGARFAGEKTMPFQGLAATVAAPNDDAGVQAATLAQMPLTLAGDVIWLPFDLVSQLTPAEKAAREKRAVTREESDAARR